MSPKNSSKSVSEDWWDVLIISQHATLRDIHLAYETLRMSYLPINRDRSMPVSPEATEQLQKLDRAFRLALDSNTPDTTSRNKTSSKKSTKASPQTKLSEKDPFHSVVQEWAKTSVQYQSPQPPSSRTSTKNKKPTPSPNDTQSTKTSEKSTTDDTKTSKKGVKFYQILLAFSISWMIGYLFNNDSTPISSTTSPTSGSSTAPRAIPSSAPSQVLTPQYNIAPTFVDPLVLDLQKELNRRGFNAGDVDGLIGPQTRNAISAAQRSLNMYVDGEPSDTLLKALRRW